MLKIELATIDDFDFFYEIKSEENNIFWTGHKEKPNKDNLLIFFEKIIKNCKKKEERKIYIIKEKNSGGVGYLYIIPDKDNFDLASAILSKYQGKGFGKKAIQLGLEEGKKLGYKKMVGSIREDNVASMKAYTACGVKLTQNYKMVYIPKLNKEVKMYIVEKDIT